MNEETEVVIVAAMEREVAPLVRGWQIILGNRQHYWTKGKVVVVTGGIGAKFARDAAEAVLARRYYPKVVISAGLSGALVPELHTGEVFVPTKVVSADGAKTFTMRSGDSVLVSAVGVANREQKEELARRFAAQVVDMEAAAVADVAMTRGLSFVAVKAISDELEFPLPPLGRFIGEDGRFHTGRFVMHAAVRPRLWPVLGRLQKNADKASVALCAVLSRIGNADDALRLLEKPGVVH